MEKATHYGSWPRQRPRRRGDQSHREGLDDDARPGLQSVDREVVPPLVPEDGSDVLIQLQLGWDGERSDVRGREQDSKRAYLGSLLLHQARKCQDHCRSVAT